MCSLVRPDSVDKNGVETSIKGGMANHVFFA